MSISPFYQTRCSLGCSTNSLVIKWLIDSVSDPFPPNIQDIISPKPLELGSWHFERIFIPPHHASHVTCHVSHLTCQVSGVRCHVPCFFSSCFFSRTKWWSLSVEGLLSMGPTLSSLDTNLKTWWPFFQPFGLWELFDYLRRRRWRRKATFYWLFFISHCKIFIVHFSSVIFYWQLNICI